MPLDLNWTRRRVLKFLGLVAVPVPVKWPTTEWKLDSSGDHLVITEYGLGFRAIAKETNPELILRMALDVGDAIRDHYWREMAAIIREHYGAELEADFWRQIAKET